MVNPGGGWFDQLLAPFHSFINHNNNQQQPHGSPGTIWSGSAASRGFAKGAMKSLSAGQKVRVAFRNQSKLPLILSWVAENGEPHHFYCLKPAEIVEGPVTALDHVENTHTGHAFCIAHAGEEEEAKIRNDKSRLEPRFVVGGYRPDFVAKEDNKNYVHLVTICQKPSKNKFKCCTPPTNHHLRGSSEQEEVGNDFDDLCWIVQAKEAQIDDKQINTSDKHYQETTLGGWPVRLEPGWHGGNKELEKRLAQDLEFAAKCLPKHARDFLKKTTPVYVNKSLQWGPEVCPINGRGLCFHPQKDWLEENHMDCEKCECVEIYCAKEYLDDCRLWGRAGVLVHEFSHAYHHKLTEGGYDNPEIKECYDKAMEDRLYDWVKVHGSQGPMAKAYACNNCMEYFAELSAAFLGQPNLHSEEEFNKWYPFNRRQIKEHDPRAYELLKKVWKVND